MWRDKLRIVGSLSFPLIFLFVFGSGLSGSMGSLTQGAGSADLDFKQFIFPALSPLTSLSGRSLTASRWSRTGSTAS